jgi:hypothetical protein
MLKQERGPLIAATVVGECRAKFFNFHFPHRILGR